MSAEAISIEVTDVEHGWAIATMRAGGRSYRVEGFSYVTHAFDDLLRLGVDAALGAHETEIVWDGEPFGWALLFQQKFEDGVWPCKFRIFEIEDANDPATPRVEVFVAEVDREQFAQAILESIKRVLDSMGIERFERSWLQAFPVRGVAALEAALSTAKRPEPDHGPAVAMAVFANSMKTFEFQIEDPVQDDVRALVASLNEFTYQLTPAEYRHHMTVDQMAAADTTVFIARDEAGAAVGMGALKRHSGGVAEVKRMFVAPSARGYGIGGQVLKHIESLAQAEGFTRLVLETGSNFDAARRVYERGGFAPCESVLDYPPSAWTAFYAKALR